MPNLVRRSSGEHVAAYIRQLILNGVLRPGQRVPQDDITKALGVSRIPVRESLISLERDGWVTIENYRGAFVNAVSPATIKDQYDLLSSIYDFAIHRAVARSGEDFIEKITALQSDLAQTTDPGVVVALIYSFYTTIADYAHSPRLQLVLRAISDPIWGEFFEAVPVAVNLERRSIPVVITALRERQTDRAVAELRRGLDEVCDALTKLFRDRGLFEIPH
jgi:DNA-binding GntR family transcriptional regulator